jgi:preprotein translocase SecE subunit
MNKVRKIFFQYSDELINKVHWPKFEDLQVQTIYVIIISIMFAILIGLSDALISFTMRFIYDNL